MAASGWRELRDAAEDGRSAGLGGRGRHRRRGARAGSGRRRRSSARRWPPSCAGWPAPPPSRRGRDRRPRRRPLVARPSAVGGAVAGAVAIDAAGLPRRRWCSCPAADGSSRWPRSSSAPAPTGLDLTRPSRGLDGPAPVTPSRAGSGPLTRATTSPRWTALGLAVTCADLVGTMRGAVALACDYAAHRQQYGAAIGSFQAVQHLLADALRRRRRDRAASPCTRRGPSTRCRPATPWPPPRSPRPTAPGRPARSARPRSRCTAASATPGSASPTSSCGGRCSRADVLGGVGASLARVLAAPRDRRSTMDFGDSPEEAEFRLRLRDWLRGQQPGPAGVVDGRRVLGRAGRLAPVALRRRLLRPVVADGDRRARPARASTTSSSTRSSPPPARRRGRASATWCRASSSTAARTISAASCPASSTGATAGARASASPTPARTWPRCAPGPSATATSTSSPATRSGRATRTTADWCLRPRPHRSRRAQAPGHLGLRRPDAPARHRAAAAPDDQRDHARSSARCSSTAPGSPPPT